jgi:hypothetical protein
MPGRVNKGDGQDGRRRGVEEVPEPDDPAQDAVPRGAAQKAWDPRRVPVRPANGVAKAGAADAKVDLKGEGATRRLVLPARPISMEQLAQAQEALAAGTLRGARAARHMDVLEAALSDPDARIVTRTALGGGVNKTYIVTLSNGARCVWKPSSEEDKTALRTRLERDHQARREAGAYLVDKAMGHYAGVPPTIVRSLSGQSGALMAYVSRASTAEGRPISVDAEYGMVAVFDNVVGNTDRHEGNLLLTRDGHKVPIDHGLTFPLSNGPQGYQNFILDEEVKLDRTSRAALAALRENRAQLNRDLKSLGIDPEAIKSLWARVQQMETAGRTVATWR